MTATTRVLALKVSILVFVSVALLIVQSWAAIGQDQAFLATAQFYGEGCHGPEDSLLVFAHYRSIPDSALQAGDVNPRTRVAFITEVLKRRQQFLQRYPNYVASGGIVEYRDSVGNLGAESESTARFIPTVDRVGFLNMEASAAETLSDGSMYKSWHGRYLRLFGWRLQGSLQVACA